MLSYSVNVIIRMRFRVSLGPKVMTLLLNSNCRTYTKQLFEFNISARYRFEVRRGRHPESVEVRR